MITATTFRSATMQKQSSSPMFALACEDLDEERLQFVDDVYRKAEFHDDEEITKAFTLLPPWLISEKFDTMEDVDDWIGLLEGK